MLHGILINYETFKLIKSKTIKKNKRKVDSEFIREVDLYKFNKNTPKQKSKTKSSNYLDKKPNKKKKQKEPKCADFKKKTWWEKLRKRD